MRYLDYMRDNPKGYWFKRKLYGWGWIPVTWQGWLFLATWFGVFVEFLAIIDKHSHSASDTFFDMIIPAILMIIVLFLVCYGTGEKPRWSWGR